jgi:ParB family chromosome partitioning protein
MATAELKKATVTMLPLLELKSGGKGLNSRKRKSDVASLARSIGAHGLLVPLLVRRSLDAGYSVIDGNRRYEALRFLHKTDHAKVEVPCLVDAGDGSALELSMVTNVEREGLHPVDRFEVYVALVNGGETVDAIAARYGLKITQVRQALALGRLAPEVRDAWREGKISAEAAEAFALTSDLKAQAAALKKCGRHVDAWQIKRTLSVDRDDLPDVGALLKYVGRDAYQKAGHHLNETLFSRGGRFDDDDDESGREVVSDLPALMHLANNKLSEECDRLTGLGWKWAVTKRDAPKDIRAWKRIERPAYAKDAMATMGCVVGLNYNGALEIERGIVKPGDAVKIAKAKPTPVDAKAKKKAAKAREEKLEETGGLSNALASRLSHQLTAAVREAFASSVGADDLLCLTIGALACAEAPLQLALRPEARASFGEAEGEDRYDNDFSKYVALARGKKPAERFRLLATWMARSIDLSQHNAGHFMDQLRPPAAKEKMPGGRVLVQAIPAAAMKTALLKHFDAKDYFSSIPKALVVEAVREALGASVAAEVAKMKTGEAQAFALGRVPKTGWVPPAMRIGKA